MLHSMVSIDIAASDLTVVSLASVGDEALVRFADGLRDEPRYFGRTNVPQPSRRWTSMLVHPARRVGFGAVIDAELVGVARLCASESEHLAMYVAVTPRWRRLGIATRLMDETLSLAGSMGDDAVMAITEHRKAAVRSLLSRYQAEATPTASRTSSGQLRFLVPLAS